jgi:hypothetical protein
MGEKTMRSQQTINQNLQHLDVDQHKAYVNQNMEKSSYRTFNHLALTHRNPSHLLPSRRWIVRQIQLLTQKYIPADELHPTGEYPTSNAQNQGKNHL